MKIAVASDGTKVSGHFGHCEGFYVFTAEDGKIVKKEYVKSPGHDHGILPNILDDLGVNLIISGGMGKGAIDLFVAKKIEIVTGAVGEAEDAVIRYLNGELISTEMVCQEHAHHHE